MTKEDHVKYWIETSSKDWKRAELLIKNKDYVFALFCLHLSVEKLIKANWVKEHKGNSPPKIHNLVTLVAKTSAIPSEKQGTVMEELNVFQIDGRYPDYQFRLYKYATKKYALQLLKQSTELKNWLLEKL